MAKIKCGCSCGAVRYTSDAEPLMTVICQCTHCQRTSGGPYSVMAALPRGSVTFSGEMLATYDDGGTSGQVVHRRFCRQCGSPIVSDAEAAPTMHFLKTGSLDDASWVRPQVAIWCASAQPWAPLPEGVAKVPHNPPFGG